jgi:hypothetical protein
MQPVSEIDIKQRIERDNPWWGTAKIAIPEAAYLNGADNRPLWIGEIKWSDRISTNRTGATRSMQLFLKSHKTIKQCFITTKTVTQDNAKLDNRPMGVIPTSLYCYMVGRNITAALDSLGTISAAPVRRLAPHV